MEEEEWAHFCEGRHKKGASSHGCVCVRSLKHKHAPPCSSSSSSSSFPLPVFVHAVSIFLVVRRRQKKRGATWFPVTTKWCTYNVYTDNDRLGSDRCIAISLRVLSDYAGQTVVTHISLFAGGESRSLCAERKTGTTLGEHCQQINNANGGEKLPPRSFQRLFPVNTFFLCS